MEKIQEGKLDKEYVINEGKEILVQILDKWKKNEPKIGKELVEALKVSEDKETTVGKCDKCGGMLRVIRLRGRGGRQFIGCKSYPNCRNAYPLPTGALVAVSEKVCETCGKPMVNIKSYKARYSMCIDPNCPTKDKWKKKASTEVKAEVKAEAQPEITVESALDEAAE
jgi:DNA topoisomerase-1